MSKPKSEIVKKGIFSKAIQRFDGWVNALTGLGDVNRDKRLSISYARDTYDQPTADEIWRGDDMAARIVETIPNEMFRQGFRVVIEGDKELGEEMDHLLRSEELDVTNKLKTILKYARAFGGGALLLGVDDGEVDLTRPLNVDNIKSFNWLNDLTPVELYPVEWYGDPMQPKYGDPALFRLQRQLWGGPTDTNIELQLLNPIIHETRLIRILGTTTSRRQQRERWSWGESIFVRVGQVITDFQAAYQAAGVMMQNFSQPVMKMAGLAELISSTNGSIFKERLQAMDMSRSVLKTIVVDAEDDFNSVAPHISGLPEMLDKFGLRLAAAVNMPVSLLMGQSPSGLNATGDTELRWFYDSVASEQVRVLKPALLKICQLIFKSKEGPTGGVEPENWTIEFAPLWAPSEKEQADIRYLQAQSDNLYVMNGTLLPEEVAKSRFGGDQYSTDTKIDLDARDTLKLADVHEAATGVAQAATAQQSADNPDSQNKPIKK